MRRTGRVAEALPLPRGTGSRSATPEGLHATSAPQKKMCPDAGHKRFNHKSSTFYPTTFTFPFTLTFLLLLVPLALFVLEPDAGLAALGDLLGAGATDLVSRRTRLLR